MVGVALANGQNAVRFMPGSGGHGGAVGMLPQNGSDSGYGASDSVQTVPDGG